MIQQSLVQTTLLLAANSRNFTIAVGETSKSFSIPILDDSEAEGTKSFDITVTITAGAKFMGGGTTKTETISIHDNEPPTLSLPTSAITVAENVESGKVDVNVTLSIGSYHDVTFDYELTDVSTTKGGDYIDEVESSKTISPGDTSSIISIPIADDLNNEGIEKFTLTLSSPVGAVFDDDAMTISKTITIEG